MQAGSIYFSVVQPLAAVACKRRGVWECFQYAEMFCWPGSYLYGFQQQELADVCGKGRKACPGGWAGGASAPGFVCWLECFLQPSVGGKENHLQTGECEGCPSAMGTFYSSPLDRAVAPDGLSCVSCLDCFQASRPAGLGAAEKVRVRISYTLAASSQAPVRLRGGSSRRGMDLSFHHQSNRGPLSALTLFPPASIILTPPPHGQTCSLQVAFILFHFFSVTTVLWENESSSWQALQTSRLWACKGKHSPGKNP